MQTTCPECSTTFRVSQDHLGARRGLVRCGSCNAVFNAYDTLLPELESPPDNDESDRDEQTEKPVLSEDVYPEAPDLPDITNSADVAQDASRLTLAERLASMELAAPAAEIAAQAESSDDVHAAPDEAAAAAEAEPAIDTPTHAATQPDILLQPMWPEKAKPVRDWLFWLQAMLAILLVGLLGLQMAYFLRAELAASVPAARPLLEAICQPLQCSVPLPGQLTKDAIAASTLEHDPDNKSRVHLTVLLANRSGQTQAWPQLVLTLSDVRQSPVAQKIFQPKTYLPQGMKVSDGLAANAEQEIQLDLDIGNLVAAGYVLSLRYP